MLTPTVATMQALRPFCQLPLHYFDRAALRALRPSGLERFSTASIPPHSARRPSLRAQRLAPRPSATRGRTRSLFIQTEVTPNKDAIKLLPSVTVVPASYPTTFIEYLTPRSTLAPPHPSPLASNLMSIEGVTSVFFGSNYITVTKATDADWAHIKPEAFALITQAVTSGVTLVSHTARSDESVHGQNSHEADSLAPQADDSEVVSMIKELLETRIRPTIQSDGGDIEYRGFEDGLVALKLRGACRTCDSSTVTLKNGIESMLMHYIEEVKGIKQVLDEEEQIAADEFARFEERLNQQAAR